LVNTRPVAALFGGTFDPPHRGHQRIVETLTRQPEIEQVIVTPAWLNPFKHRSLATPEQRLEWCRQLFDAPGVLVDAGEIRAERPVYTAETLDRLNRTYDVRYLVIGSDNLAAIERWHDFDRINDAVTWLVFERPGYTKGYDKLNDYRRFALDMPISSTAIRTERSTRHVDPVIAPQVHQILTKGSE